MADAYFFRPPRRSGFILHAMAVIVLAAIGVLSVWRASQAEVGPVFILYLLPAALTVALTPVLLYRAYALWGAGYTLERDGIRLQWGWRVEDIPMNQILWVHLDSDLGYPLPLPRLCLPGAVLGSRRLPDAKRVEFLCARTSHLVVVATAERVYAISPIDVNGFLRAFQSLTEFGSLTPIPARSIYPSILVSRFWSDRLALFLVFSGLALSLALYLWVSLSIPTHPQISLKLSESGGPLEFVPAVRLLLLPVLNSFFFLANTLLGLFFYRRSENQAASYLLWGSSLITATLFLGAVYFILNAG
jgi:hypothetical protein